MSKTAQRKRGAFDKGCFDGFNGRTRSWTKRIGKPEYESGYRAGKADRDRLYLRKKETTQ